MRFCFVVLMSVALLLQLPACKTPAIAGGMDATGNGHNEPATTDAADSTATSGAKQAPSIISIILNARAQGQDVTWTISGVSVSAGRFKRNLANVRRDYLHAYFTDDAGHRLDSTLFEHPLSTRIESPTDQGSYKTEIINKTKGTAYLRANNNAAITTLLIYSADHKQLATFNLTDLKK